MKLSPHTQGGDNLHCQTLKISPAGHTQELE